MESGEGEDGDIESSRGRGKVRGDLARREAPAAKGTWAAVGDPVVDTTRTLSRSCSCALTASQTQKQTQYHSEQYIATSTCVYGNNNTER